MINRWNIKILAILISITQVNADIGSNIKALKCPVTISKTDAEKIATNSGLLINGLRLKADDPEQFIKNLPSPPSSQNNKGPLGIGTSFKYSLKLDRQVEVNGQTICQYPYKSLIRGKVELDAILSNESGTEAVQKPNFKSLKCPVTFNLIEARKITTTGVRVDGIKLKAVEPEAFYKNLPSSSVSSASGNSLTFKPKLDRQIERNGQIICQYSYKSFIRGIIKPLDVVISN